MFDYHWIFLPTVHSGIWGKHCKFRKQAQKILLIKADCVSEKQPRCPLAWKLWLYRQLLPNFSRMIFILKRHTFSIQH